MLPAATLFPYPLNAPRNEHPQRKQDVQYDCQTRSRDSEAFVPSSAQLCSPQSSRIRQEQRSCSSSFHYRLISGHGDQRKGMFCLCSLDQTDLISIGASRISSQALRQRPCFLLSWGVNSMLRLSARTPGMCKESHKILPMIILAQRPLRSVFVLSAIRRT